MYRTVVPYFEALGLVSKAPLLHVASLAAYRPEAFSASELHPFCLLPVAASRALQYPRRVRGSAFFFGLTLQLIWFMRSLLLYVVFFLDFEVSFPCGCGSSSDPCLLEEHFVLRNFLVVVDGLCFFKFFELLEVLWIGTYLLSNKCSSYVSSFFLRAVAIGSNLWLVSIDS